MAVALEYLVGDGGGVQAELAAGFLLDLRRYGGIGADRPGYLAHGDDFLGFGKPVQVAPHLFHPERQLQTEGDRLGMDAVGAAYHERIFMLDGALRQDGGELFDILDQDIGGFDQLQAGGGIHDIGRGQAEVDVAGLLAEAFGHRAEESGHIMVGLFEDFLHALEVALGQLYLGDGLAGDDADLRPGIADGDFHIQPLVEFVFVRPYPFHFGPGIPLNHSSFVLLSLQFAAGIFRKPVYILSCFSPRISAAR